MSQDLYQPHDEQIVTGDNSEKEKIAERCGYIFFSRDKSKITYRAQGRTYDFKNPKEKVRLECYFDLIEKYQYPMNAIEFDVAAPKSAKKQYADIVVYTDAVNKNAYIVIGCKKEGISSVKFEQAVKQVIANARAFKARFAVCVAGNTRRVIEMKKWNEENPKKAIVADMPVAYDK